ncbi:MAG TPA: transcription antitermination factor NusB, partial [Limnochordia bacterium]|nr:transcription antitermination factor NusB [Limnochordia bacterium]
MSAASPARRLAVGVLERVDAAGAFANLALDQALRRASLDGRERAFATQLVYGTIRYLGQIDYVLAAVSSKPPAELDPGVRAALRLGLYQLLQLPHVPAATACDQSVELIKLRRPQAAGFVNGVLRGALRRLPTFPWPDPQRDLAEALAVRESHPRWLVERWLDTYGPEATRAICRSNNQPAPTALRVNTLKTTRAALAAELGAAESDLPGWSPAAIFLTGESRSDQLAALRAGRCSVQAASAQLAAPALDPQPGWLVYDLCSAPGGKATHLAELMHDRGQVVACE